MSTGTPWGMIKARQERGSFRSELVDLRRQIKADVQSALALLDKPEDSRAEAIRVLQNLIAKLG